MDWNDLRYFLAVARHGSVSAAAKNLGISVQTVGRRIDSLEAALGTSLFLRLASGYTLTQDGLLLIADAEHVEEAVATFSARAHGQKKGLSGLVKLAAPETLITHLILPELQTLLSTHPELTLELLIGVAPVGIARGDADLALRYIKPERGTLTVQCIGPMTHGLFAAPHLVQRTPDLMHHPFAHRHLVGWDSAHEHLVAARWLHKYAKRAPDLRCDNLEAQSVAIRHGLGIGLSPHYFGENLVALIPPAALPQEDLWLVTHEAGASSERIQVVRNAICTILETHRHKLGPSN